ncbi:MAG: Gfo/Idh/MocA family oxidoreductase [Oscillospiraceae bacterium]|nr:Gfo/Idh/MocA family oxidoreductase [Oscillospiraceae bacterium]
MKKIGFIDFFLSQWHANNYPQWIREANEKLGTDYAVAYAWAEKDVSPYDGVTTDEWCRTMGVERCATIEEVCRKSDAIVILSPDDPENHLPYAKAVLPYGKPTYMDKPFAATVEDALEMEALIKAHGTPFFTTSALRYATELDAVEDCYAIATMGGGRAVLQYLIHQIEMVVKKLGIGAKTVRMQKLCEDQKLFTVRYADDRSAVMHFAAGAPFAVTMSQRGADAVTHSPVTSAIFDELILDMVRFFETGRSSFDMAETMEANRIFAACLKAEQTPDQEIAV